MGGGSSVNNLVVVRPMRRDFDAWVGVRRPAWSYDALLPMMRAIETDRGLRRQSAPRLERAARPAPPVPAGRPGRSAGRAPSERRPTPSACRMPGPQRPGAVRRSAPRRTTRSTADASRSPSPTWTRRAAGPTSTSWPTRRSTRLVLDGTRVRASRSGRRGDARTIEADARWSSPPARSIRRSSCSCRASGRRSPRAARASRSRHRLDGVGENYQDHAVIYITFQGTTELREDYVIPKVRLIAKSSDRPDHADLHVFMRPSIRMPGMPPLLPVSIHLLEHRSRGRVGLASADPDGAAGGRSGPPARIPADVGALRRRDRLRDRLTAHPRPGRVLRRPRHAGHARRLARVRPTT